MLVTAHRIHPTGEVGREDDALGCNLQARFFKAYGWLPGGSWGVALVKKGGAQGCKRKRDRWAGRVTGHGVLSLKPTRQSEHG